MSCLEELDHFESWMMFEVIGFMNEETHRSQIVTPYTKQYSREYSLNWLSYCAPVYLQISFNCKDILNFRLWSIMLDTGSALQFFHGRVHWPGSGVSSTLCGRCPEHLRTFDAGSILERERTESVRIILIIMTTQRLWSRYCQVYYQLLQQSREANTIRSNLELEWNIQKVI